MQTNATYPAEPATTAAHRTKIVPGLDVTNLLMIIGGITLVYVASRTYMHAYAFTAGLDYFEPEFAQYWMPVFWTQITVLPITLVAIIVYLWRTRELAPDRVLPEVELNRYFYFLAWLTAYTLIIFIAGTPQGESDATWHQIVIRDTDFTPTHIGLFYLCIPGMVITAFGAYIYAKTRLPMHHRRHLLPLGIALGVPF